MTNVLILDANGQLARNTTGAFLRDPDIRYRITQKGEPFKGHDVSLNSLSDLIVKLAADPALHLRKSIGVSAA
ncbi:hypothetical protein RHSP_56513 [Rhizobium freirei PRF 81]|uniref:Uncharacterized protein n=1 Tax=Rhizobium freirei PRF 81 TaxID=363754 RepID=N6UWM4_9HYPH|nr:hypothetical protein [Rhizobium freirei]ENN85136.1 hypothetical protein RHSP_56513 [Rhizobium freirei PRF 81]